MSDLFASPEMVAGYARSRPAVHPRIVDRARARLGFTGRVERALDVGCGAGLSTLPLRNLASVCVGVEPVAAMVTGTPLGAPGVGFVAGRAETLPVRARSIDLMTAAGSLNFVDLDAFFPEALRVLRVDGALLVYDFSAGRTSSTATALDDWFTEFRRRYPRLPGVARALDPASLASLATGFRLVDAEEFSIGVALDADAYRDYVMTETNVAYAIQAGEDVDAIRAWCSASLAAVFASDAHEVQFPAYLAHLTPTSP
jgi:ubiquinone/menaquinone biosynthesis C-methylase UbiE